MTEISNNAKIINVSDITARVDELRQERAEDDKTNGTERDEDGALTGASVDEDGLPVNGTWEEENTDEAEELARLEKLLDDLRGRGTSHDWGGNKYPHTLIADYHFTDYVQEFAEDCGAVSRDASWVVVDWEATAKGVKQDFRSVDFDGAEYWHRA
jgi:hypothetical protein